MNRIIYRKNRWVFLIYIIFSTTHYNNMETFGNLTINQLLENMSLKDLELLRSVLTAKVQTKVEQVPQKTEQVSQKTEQAVVPVPQKTEQVPQKTEQVHQKTEKVQKTPKVKDYRFQKGTYFGQNKCLYCEDQVQRVMVGSFTTAKGKDEPIQSFNKDGSFHCHQAGKFFRNKRCFDCEKKVFGHILSKSDWRVMNKSVGVIGVFPESFEGIPTRFVEMEETEYNGDGYDIIDHGICTHFQ